MGRQQERTVPALGRGGKGLDAVRSPAAVAAKVLRRAWSALLRWVMAASEG
ncbi:hypothetical protein ABT354_08365 [Streptomyces sp. NPDC000594]|uniref:hypothetical protein n=1 Tax=Streptomyces sp. NPDC000594 TaxID=3154261 RepID=UPI0033323D0D